MQTPNSSLESLGVVTAHFLPTFAYLVQKVGDLCGKHTEVDPCRHEAVRLACCRG
jgi:hypothetical protein